MKHLFLLMLYLFFSFAVFSQTKKRSGEHLPPGIIQVLKDFEYQLEKDVRQDDIGSMSAAIFIDKKVVWSKAYGWADKRRHIKADTNTIYRTGSITKTFTAFLMMLLMQDGTIKIDDPVAKYFPEINDLKRSEKSAPVAITFRQLAANTGGVAEEPEQADAATGPFQDWEKKLVAAIPTVPVIAVPGSKFEYSNIGYSILGLALSKAARQSYPSLITDKILHKLSMNNSFFQIPEGKETQVAAGYSINPFTGQMNDKKPAMEHKGRGYKVPTGGLYATANDLARFLIEQCHSGDEGSLLTRQSSEMMTSIQTPESNVYGYGLGYYIRTNDSGFKIIEHDGEVSGYNSFMAYSPEFKVGIVLLRNYNFGLTNILQRPRVVLYEMCQVLKQHKH